jgi:hypothetical protein
MKSPLAVPRVSPWLRFALALLVGASSANAQVTIKRYPHFIFPVCLEDLFVVEVPPIVVGCEAIDCCPGCPGTPPIDWRILVEGPVAQLALQFDSSAVSPRDLAIEGPARWGPQATLLVGRGRSTLRGLPRATRARTVSARPRVQLDSAAVPVDTVGGHAPDGGPTEVSARVVIEQLVGGVIVNERVFVYRVRRCGRPPLEVRTDRIDLSNNNGGDNAVVFLDARRSTGCANDEIRRGVGRVSLGSVLANGGCRSEAVVFSDDDAVTLIENVTAWTDPLGDLLSVGLTPDRWQVPVDVWITQAALQARSQNELAQADFLLNTSHAGVDVLANVTFRAIPTAANAAAINTTAGNVWSTNTCSVAAITGNPAIFTANRINVYFVNQALTGWWCPNSNVIAIGTAAQPETLAHEFGHAFTLAHTNVVDYTTAPTTSRTRI